MRLNLAPVTAFFAGAWRWLLICAACAALAYLPRDIPRPAFGNGEM